MRRVDIGGASDRLAEIFDQVHAEKNPITVSRDGDPLVAVIPIEDLELIESLRSGAVDELKEQQRKSQALFDETEHLARLGHWEWDEVADRVVSISRGMASLYGTTVESYLRQTDSTEADSLWIYPEDRHQYAQVSIRLRRYGIGFESEHRLVQPGGGVLHVREVASPVFGEDGSLVRSIGFVQDISRIKEAEAKLRRAYDKLEQRVEKRTSELAKKSAQLQSIMDHSSAMIFLKDAEGLYELVNREFENTFGTTNENVKGKLPEDVVPSSLAEISSAQDKDVLDTGLSSTIEGTFDIDGRRRTVLTSKFPILGDGGRAVGIGAVATDITERKEAEAKVRANEARLDQAVKLAGLGHWVWDAVGNRCIYCSEENARINGVPLNDFLAKGSRIDALIALVHPDDRADVKATNRELRDGRAFEKEYRLLTPAGETRYVREVARPVLGEDGRVVQEFGTIQDITEVRQAEEEVRLRSSQLKAILENSPIEIVLKNTAGRTTMASRNAAETRNLPAAAVMGATVADYYPPEIAKIYMAADRQVVETGKALQREVREEIDGVVSYYLSQKFPTRDEQGKITGLCSMTTDITDMKEAQARLAQAQKMEAVGQLTGGVAHDFNNLLAVIRGNAELLALQVGGDNALVQTIERASIRGAQLTQRLLAFSRQQPLQPQPTNLGELVDDMRELLQRTLGEAIEIEWVSKQGLVPAFSDPGQLENALLNLAINARDAMPEGGKLTIECAHAQLGSASLENNREARSGDYVVLAVSDEGKGMTAEVRAHAFEPFFTTKEVGEGSGLGLSMVYGFAKQSGGHVSIESEEGRGTTIKLYLPRAEEKTEQVVATLEEAVPHGSGELVLVIEDDPDVRALAVRMLKDLNYRVIDVPDAATAHEALAQETSVDLVLSDVVLPGGISGPEFAAQVRATGADLRIVFMSGNPAGAPKGNALLGSDDVLLNKPFQRCEFAKAIREALD